MSEIKKMKDLEDENCRLKEMFANLSLECRALKNVIAEQDGLFLPARYPAPLATPEALNQNGSH